MIELVRELSTASGLLNDAIQRYANACYAIKNFYGQTTELSGVPRALSDRVANELVSANSYEMEVKRARSAISQARNCSPTITPIHTLPTEILARIFYLVTDARPCNVSVNDNSGINIHFPKYPDILSHICSRWRHTVLALPALWSHIDLVSCHPRTRGFTSRAEACATRAGHLPLEIHIREALQDVDDDAIFPFLKACAKRIGSLELAVPDLERSEDFEISVLESVLGRCTPGTFTKLAITGSGADQAAKFINAQANDPNDFDWRFTWLPLTKKRFEKVMLPVTVLRLDGLYPLWTSQAYRGLVELSLTCGTDLKLKISPSELHSILDNNPRLRVLDFGHDIIDTPPENSNALNLPLLDFEHLEVLTLRFLGPEELNVILPFIAPGPGPLQLHIYYRENYSLLAEEHELVRFFKRSNITRLYVQGDYSCPPIGDLVSLMPNLSSLVLHGFDDDDEDRRRLSQKPTHQAPPSSTPSLSELYLIECRIYLSSLQKVIKRYSIQELIFWQSGVHRDEPVPKDELREELSGLCPSLKFISDEDPNPVEHWD